jgi:poly-beta-hydroxyalkanoate depolymerase
MIGSLRSPPPYPATPDFPLCRGQNKTLRDNLLKNPPLEMTMLASSIQSFQKGTNDKKRYPHPRHFDRSEAEWRNLTPQMTEKPACTLRHFDRSEAEWRNLTPQMTEKPACTLRHFDRSEAEWRNLPL